MISEEIGFKELLEEVFSINSDEELLNSLDFEIKSLEYVTVNTSAYEKIINYLKSVNDISLDTFLAINATLAYGHHPKELDIEIDKFITMNIEHIIKYIDSIKKLEQYLNKESVQNYESILVNNISYNLIRNIVSLTLNHSILYKNIHFYGIQNLLLNLSKYSHEEFSDWFLRTDRKDLQVVYIESMLNFIHSVDTVSESNVNSKITFVRAFSKIIFYNLDRNLRLSSFEKKFYELDSNKENIYFLLYHFSNRTFNLRDSNSVRSLNEDIKKSSKLLDNMDKDILKEFLNNLNISIAYGLVDEIANVKLRMDLLNVLFEDLKRKIELEEFINNFTIEKANVLGNVILLLGEDSLIQLLTNFNDIIKKMEEPYYVYKYHNNWYTNISKLVHYLIPIFIYYKEKNDKKYIEYKDSFIEIKKDFVHTNDEDINEILKQIN